MPAVPRVGPAPSGREIDRFLKRLEGAGFWRISTSGTCSGETASDESRFRLVATPGASERRIQSQEVLVAAPVLRSAMKQGLIERCGAGTLRVSQTGRARLRRASGGDDGFRAQHQARGTRTLAQPDGSREVLAVDHGESPLSWLRNRKGADGQPLIDASRFEAGERLRSDVTFGRIVPGLATQSWDGAGGTGGKRSGASGIAELSDATIAARSRVDRALKAVGPELAPVLIDVCCELKGLGEVEKARRWPPRSGKIVLMMGLARLARHYGLMP
ncbi:DUF6456 domain-containing protein [Stappia stellulata]|uniref:DUF6456 domain-containing protein n=1 Tax=Stappia stellulata TaxID=71235 RepID=UPI0003FB69BB|nr:DUF6456 domain-containing protein [Stappia stellulata]